MKILIDLICGALFKIGGTAKESYPLPGVDKKGARVLGLPMILGLSLSVTLGRFIPLLCIGSYQALRLGYGIPSATDQGSFLGRIFKLGWITRGVYGLVTSLAGASPLLLCGLHKEVFIAYALINAGIAGALDFLSAPAMLIEIAQGLGYGLILFIH